MYDEIKHIVNVLAIIIAFLGLAGYLNSKGGKPSGSSKTKKTDNQEDIEATGYSRPEDAGARGYGRPEDAETTGYRRTQDTESADYRQQENAETAAVTYVYTNGTYSESQPSENKSPNILKQFEYSFIPHKYEKLAAVKTGGMIGFVTLLSLVSTLCIFAVFVITYVERGGASAFLDWIPNFELRDGILSLDDDYYIKDTGYVYVYLTDQIDGFRQDDIDHIIEQGYGKAILGGSEKVVLIKNGEYFETYYTAYGDNLVLNREIVLEKLMPILWVIFVIMAIIFFVVRTFWYFGCASLYFLAALLITTLIRGKIPAGILFRTAIYAKVPMFVVTTFWTSPYLSGIFRIIITVGFMAFAIGHLLSRQRPFRTNCCNIPVKTSDPD